MERGNVILDFWLLLCKHASSYPAPDPLLEKILSLKKLLSKIISTSKNSLKQLPPSH
jgi:hypothetical protein